MGMDLVEIAMSLEEVFQLRLEDDFWARLFQPDPHDLAAGTRYAKPDVTVGRVYEALILRLKVEGRYHEDQTLESTLQEVLSQLRKHFSSENLTPATEFKSLLGRRPTWNDWYQLGPVFSLELAPIQPPGARLRQFLPISLVALYAGLLLVFFSKIIGTLFAVTAFVVTLIVALIALLDPNNGKLPGYLRTVEGMAEQVHIVRISLSKNSKWSERTVWIALQKTLTDVLGLDEQLITPTTRLVKDLSAI